MFAGYFRQEGKQTSEREKIGLPSGQRWLVDASWSMRASEAPPICLLRGGLENASLFLIFFLLFRDSTYFVRWTVWVAQNSSDSFYSLAHCCLLLCHCSFLSQPAVASPFTQWKQHSLTHWSFFTYCDWWKNHNNNNNFASHPICSTQLFQYYFNKTSANSIIKRNLHQLYDEASFNYTQNYLNFIFVKISLNLCVPKLWCATNKRSSPNHFTSQ